MSPLYLQNGKLLVKDGALASSAACCCTNCCNDVDGCDCFKLMVGQQTFYLGSMTKDKDYSPVILQRFVVIMGPVENQDG